MIKCQICFKQFSNKGNLNQHTKINNKSKAFKCDVCMKVFSTKFNLEVHQRAHTGEKPYACQVCNKKIARKDNLVRHQATHSDVRSFKCSICPKGRLFKTKDGLNSHMVFHYEPKFACSQCDYKCHKKWNLKVHEKTHDKK